mmetsp:Transcript_43842/g.110542  ORF Transcript_43842/g.110542 Transcript_43842/m.110542 type:complete len:502 (-) Transcript_43842:16-1521(-)
MLKDKLNAFISRRPTRNELNEKTRVFHSPSGNLANSLPVNQKYTSVSKQHVWNTKVIVHDDWLPEEQLGFKPLLVLPPDSKFHVESGRSELPPESIDLGILESSYDNRYYFFSLFNQGHYNYVGYSDEHGPFVISVEDPCPGEEESNILRVIVRDRQCDHRVTVVANNKGSVAKSLVTVFPKLSGVKLTRADHDFDINNNLVEFERTASVNAKQIKVGVLYAAEGQSTEDVMFNNVSGSRGFNAFLESIGNRVELQTWKGFRGGLDCKQNSTGTHSIHTFYKSFDIMFHVSTLLPFFPDDSQQIERKRHLGNDIIMIIYKEGGGPVDPSLFKTQFVHVYIVISPVKMEKSDYELMARAPGYVPPYTHAGKDVVPEYFQVAVATKYGVPPHKPYLPHCPIFPNDANFRDVLLTKVINAERSSLFAPVFKEKTSFTRSELLKALVQDVLVKTPQHSLDKLTFAYSLDVSGRKDAKEMIKKRKSLAGMFKKEMSREKYSIEKSK